MNGESFMSRCVRSDMWSLDLTDMHAIMNTDRTMIIMTNMDAIMKREGIANTGNF